MLICERSSLSALRGATCLVLALFAAPAWACYAAPAQQLIGVKEHLAQANDVMVAQVIAATPLGGRNVEYRFSVLQRLAGAERTTFELMGYRASDDARDTTFDRHSAPVFWAYGGGRVMNDMDCVIHPSFTLGASYLVFLDSTPTRRNFEKIDVMNGAVDEGDKWLAYVKAYLGPRPAPDPGKNVSADRPDYERIGKFIYAFFRFGVSPDALRSLAPGAQVSADIVQRAHRLADEFDRILAVSAEVPDAEIEAALREAAAITAMLKDQHQ